MNRFELSRQECEHIKYHLTDDEKAVFDLRRAGKSLVEMTFALQVSESTVKRRIRSIERKLNKFSCELNVTKN